MNSSTTSLTRPDDQKGKDQLCFLTCGSSGDGKSILLERLFYDSKTVAEHQSGFASQYFTTDKRQFIAIDTPEPEQYTRTLVSGASKAELAIILVDARNGILTQTRRDSYIVALLGIRQVILAVNKMDLLDYQQSVFESIGKTYQDFARQIGLDNVHCVPLSALSGENIFSRQGAMPWYQGPLLIELLETFSSERNDADRAFRLPVQQVNQADDGFRGFSGTIASGAIECGATVSASLSGRQSSVTRIISPADDDLNQAVAGQAVTVVLADDIDIGQGDLLSAGEPAPLLADQFAAHLIWMDSEAMLPERQYLIRLASASATAQITSLSYRIDVDSLQHLAAKKLERDEIAYCKIALDQALAFDPYSENRHTGAFILIDKFTHATVGAGTIDFALRRASNIAWHMMKVDKVTRSKSNAQTPCVLWFTGLSGAGKSTIADRLEQKLYAAGKRTYLLDGDNVRHGLNKDLGFTDQDRVENIRRVAEVAKLMVDAGLIVLSSFISPFRDERQMARALLEENEFIEIFIDTPLEVCESRDPKGLYKKARAGQLKNFTGIDSDYEAPLNAEVTLKAGEHDVEALVDQLIDYLQRTGRI